jgi:hypothetical protein
LPDLAPAAAAAEAELRLLFMLPRLLNLQLLLPLLLLLFAYMLLLLILQQMLLLLLLRQRGITRVPTHDFLSITMMIACSYEAEIDDIEWTFMN